MFILLLFVSVWFANCNAYDENIFHNCDNYQELELGQVYYIYNKQFPDFYKPGEQCRWVAYSPPGYKIKLECNPIQIFDDERCRQQQFLISINGKEDLSDAEIYCGEGRQFSVKSVGNQMAIALRSSPSSSGGRFSCSIRAYKEDQTKPAVTEIPDKKKECSCGGRNFTINRLLGGSFAKAIDYPIMAALIDMRHRYQLCGATIISDRYVLTTAHCTGKARTIDMYVLVGDQDITSSDDTQAAVKYKIAAVVIHQKFNKKSREHDIALVKTSKKIIFSSEVLPACLPFRYLDETFKGFKLTAVGWGRKTNNELASTTLNKISMYVQPNSMCEMSSENVLCTLSKEGGPCSDDSGGPIAYLSEEGALFLIGIIERSEESCADKIPTSNLKVTKYLDWIKEKTKGTTFCET